MQQAFNVGTHCRLRPATYLSYDGRLHATVYQAQHVTLSQSDPGALRKNPHRVVLDHVVSMDTDLYPRMVGHQTDRHVVVFGVKYQKARLALIDSFVERSEPQMQIFG